MPKDLRGKPLGKNKNKSKSKDKDKKDKDKDKGAGTVEGIDPERLRGLLGEEQLGTVEAMFADADANGDGTVDAGEAGRLLRRMGLNPTEADVAAWLAESDVDASGSVTVDDFVVMYVKDIMKESHGLSVDEAFGLLDTNGDGHVDADELVHLLTSMGEPLSLEDARALIAEVDADDDGRLSVPELAALMQSW